MKKFKKMIALATLMALMATSAKSEAQQYDSEWLDMVTAKAVPPHLWHLLLLLELSH